MPALGKNCARVPKRTGICKTLGKGNIVPDISAVPEISMELPDITVEPGYALLAAKESVFAITPDVDPFSFMSVSFVYTNLGKLIKADADSIYFTVTMKDEERTQHYQLPCIAKFGAINDSIVFAVKQTKVGTYIWCVPVKEMLSWKAPSSAAIPINEDGIFVSYMVPHADLKELAPLVDTTTHKTLRATVDKFISHCSTFRAAKMRSIACMKKHAGLGFAKAVTVALIAGEDIERKAAADKGKKAKAKAPSKGCGEDAQKKWAACKEALLALTADGIALPFEKRHLELRVEATGKPTEEVLKDLKLKLACAPACLERTSRLQRLGHISSIRCVNSTGRTPP